MTRIVFYIGVSDRYQFLLKFLQRKVFLSRLSALVFGEEAIISDLDTALWKADGFLPHVRMEEEIDDKTPIILSATPPRPDFVTDILISLTPELPAFLGRFPTYVDIVGQHDIDVKNGRKRYRYLHEHGYSIDVHKTGG